MSDEYMENEARCNALLTSCGALVKVTVAALNNSEWLTLMSHKHTQMRKHDCHGRVRASAAHIV